MSDHIRSFQDITWNNDGDLTITADGKTYQNVKRFDGSDATNLITFLHRLSGRDTLVHSLFRVDGDTAYIL